MFIDLSCPVEIFRTVMPTEEVPAATLTLFNLSDRVIASVEAHLSLMDARGSESEKLAYRGRALNGRPHSTFQMTIPCAPGNGVKQIEAVVEKVWFADNEVWRRDPSKAVEYEPNDLPVTPALTSLKYVAGETAVGYPSRQDGLWVCVCGRPNAEAEEYCARCGRQRDEVFTCFSPEAVAGQISLRERQLDLSSRNMREDTIRLQRLREEEYNVRKARRGSRIRLAVFLAVAAVLVLGALFFGAPQMKLMAGLHDLETGNPARARITFESLGSFGNAPELVRECDWQSAVAMLDNDPSTDDLASASALLRTMPDRPEALEKANEADLLRGRLLLQEEKWEEALAVVTALPDDLAGREELLRDCRLSEGRALLKDRDYDSARELFLGLWDLPEARDLAAECLYRPAKEQMADGDWDTAIQTLSRIPDYRDSRTLTLECHYRKAMALETEGNYAEASNEYLMAGEYEDALQRSRNLTYWMAEDLRAKGDIRGAQTLFASIPDYLDSNEKDRLCRYQLALNAFDDREFTMTLQLLENIPDDYEDTGLLRSEASYEKAKAAMKQEDWSTAAALLGSLDRAGMKKSHRDVEDLYLQACREAGIDPYPATPEPDEPVNTEPAVPAAVSAPAPDGETPTPVPFLVSGDDEP